MLLSTSRLFDGRSPEVRHDAVVEIGGTVITEVRPRRPEDSTRPDLVDFGDATLLPGLVDVHQHLCFDASPDPVARVQAEDDRALGARMRENARRAVAVGITTVRDLGDREYLALGVRDWFAAGREVGPRILASGPPITSPRGHCWFLGGETEGVDGVRAAVRERAARGADLVKVMASGGNLTPTTKPHESQFGAEALAAAAEEAHVHGLLLAVHAHGGQAIADAVEAGADSIEHCSFFTADGVEADPGVLQRIADSGIVVSPTAASLPGQFPEAIQSRLAAMDETLATLHDLGARIVCSSDAGIAPVKPHDVLPHGVVNALPRWGMTNVGALRSVTRVAAEACGLGDVTGTIEAGKEADLLVVNGDPTVDLAALHDVVAVFARGARLATGAEPAAASER